MASDNHVHFARIGAVVIAGAIAIAATLIYLGGFSDRNSEFMLETYYDYPVTGLSVGSPVNLSGVQVGEVREIGFAEHIYWECGAVTTGFKRVCIVMALKKSMFGGDSFNEAYLLETLNDGIAHGMRATVSMNGITGLARIDLKTVENPPPIEPLGWTPRYPVVPPVPSLMENLATTANRILDQIKKMNLSSVWSNIQVTAEAAANLAGNVDSTFENNRAGISELMRDIHQVTVEARELSRTLNENPSLIFRPRDAEELPETEL